jgi:hypothetical protein
MTVTSTALESFKIEEAVDEEEEIDDASPPNNTDVSSCI